MEEMLSSTTSDGLNSSRPEAQPDEQVLEAHGLRVPAVHLQVARGHHVVHGQAEGGEVAQQDRLRLLEAVVRRPARRAPRPLRA